MRRAEFFGTVVTLSVLSLTAALYATDPPPERSVGQTRTQPSGGPDCTDDPPGFQVTWEIDPNVLLGKLLKTPPPAGVTITAVRVVPDQAHEGVTIAQNSAIGYYADFSLADASRALTLPDGIVLTTGAFFADNNYANWCNNDTRFGLALGHSGDAQVQALFAEPPATFDAIALSIEFTTDSSIQGLRFKVVLASDEFPEFAAPQPTPTNRPAW
jgi:hypothetical protein